MEIKRAEAKVSTVSHIAWQVTTKVPKITIYFWILKLLTTAMGESLSDHLVVTIDPVIAVILGFVGLVIALVLQFSVKRYVAWTYWLAAAMVSVFGTMAADVLHVQFHVPYMASTLFYMVVLAIIFILWQKTEGTLSIHSVQTPRREAFYWAAVLATFALGTAAGDLTAISLHLGYLTSGVLFAIIFALPAIGYWLFRLNAIFAFWFAYIITRPFGASFADWIGKSPNVGGLGLGEGTMSLILIGLIIMFTVYVTVTRVDSQTKHAIE